MIKIMLIGLLISGMVLSGCNFALTSDDGSVTLVGDDNDSSIDLSVASVNVGHDTCIAYVSSAPTVANATWETIVFDVEVIDEGNRYSTVTGRYTADDDLRVLVNTQIEWRWNDVMMDNDWRLQGYLNGGSIIQFNVHSSVDDRALHNRAVVVVDMDENDYLEFKVRHTAGSNIQVEAGSNESFINIVVLEEL